MDKYNRQNHGLYSHRLIRKRRPTKNNNIWGAKILETRARVSWKNRLGDKNLIYFTPIIYA